MDHRSWHVRNQSSASGFLRRHSRTLLQGLVVRICSEPIMRPPPKCGIRRDESTQGRSQVAVRATYAIHTGLGYGRLDVEDEDHDKDDEATDGVDKSGVQCCKLMRGGGRVGGDRGEGANRSGLGYEHSSGSDGEQQ